MYKRFTDLHIGDELRIPFKVRYMFHWFDGQDICINCISESGCEICVIAEERDLTINCPWDLNRTIRGRSVLMVKKIIWRTNNRVI